MAKARVVSRWWLEAGTELCPACNQLYLYETEYRCADCDGPLCTDCVQTRESAVVCRSCFECGDQSTDQSTDQSDDQSEVF